MNALLARGLLALLFSLAAAVPAAAELRWRDNPRLDDVLAAGSTDPVLLYFTAPWCGPCRLLEREVFANDLGRAELAHYALVRLDLDHPEGRLLADSLRVGTVPTFVMLAPDGVEIERIRGYRTRRTLLRDLARFRAGEGTLQALQADLAARPGDASLQVALGLRHYEHLDLMRADELLTTGFRDPALLPDTLAADGGRALAELHLRQDDPEAAARVLERLLARRPDHAYPRVTWQLLARCRREAGDPEGAAAAMLEAARIEPIRAESLAAFARTAAEARWRLEDAEVAARQAVDLTDRQDPESLAALADVLRRRQRYPEAMVWIKRAVAAAPEETRFQREREIILAAAIRGD